ncbi:MAG TPA: hypothetical protein VF185_03055 [Patescibacteria group bacterium]
MAEIYFPGKTISEQESQLWTPESYLRVPSTERKNGFYIKGKVVESAPINPLYWTDQHSPYNFFEFEASSVQEELGYKSDQLRQDACGITSLHIVLGSLSGTYQRYCPTVGMLAKKALSFHRNDLKDGENVVKKGNPVFNLKVGWYHNALIYVAGKFGVDGHRFQDATLEEVSDEMERLNDGGKRALAIVSVKDCYRNAKIWRGVSHLVVVNGAKLNRKGEVVELKVTDPSSRASVGEPIEKWVRVDREQRNNFLGKAIFLYTNK